MTTIATRAALAAALTLGSCGCALARGGGSGGDGLSPYAALSGNDRSAGVNNGNYRDPRLDPYLRTYGTQRDQDRSYGAPRRGYYGYPY